MSDHDHDHHNHDHPHSHSHSRPVSIQLSDPNKAPPDVLIAANYLRNAKKSRLKPRQGQFNGKRVDYFKGKAAINALLRPAYNTSTSKPHRRITTRDEAIKMLLDLGMKGFFLHVERGESPGKGSPRPLQISQQQTVKEDWYYMWVWEGSQWLLYLAAAGMVAVILAGVMFPLWPPILRLGVWYISIAILGMIGMLMGIAVVRLIFYVITMIFLSPGIWIFPNLFEDVSVIDSFFPLWDWDKPKAKKIQKTKTEENEDEEGEKQVKVERSKDD